MTDRTRRHYVGVLAAVCLGPAVAGAAVTTITINDLDEGPPTVTGDGGRAVSINESTSVNPNPGIQVDAHPPGTAFTTWYLTEPGATGQTVSDTFVGMLVPNNDGTTAQFSFTFNSDTTETGIPGTIPGTANVILEDANGVNVTSVPAGVANTVWRLGSPTGAIIPVTDFTTQNQLVVIVKSDVPEPASLALLACGAAGVLRRRRPSTK